MIEGISRRDWFAAQMDKDEYGEIAYKNLSVASKEALVGRERPPEPNRNTVSKEAYSEYRIEVVRFELAVQAKLRFMFADAMIDASKEKS